MRVWFASVEHKIAAMQRKIFQRSDRLRFGFMICREDDLAAHRSEHTSSIVRVKVNGDSDPSRRSGIIASGRGLGASMRYRTISPAQRVDERRLPHIVRPNDDVHSRLEFDVTRV